MRLEFSDQAEADLEAIADYISRDNPTRAGSFVAELRAAGADLLPFPQAFPELAPGAGTRKRVHRKYLILYRVDSDVVLILAITHGARDYPRPS